MTTLDRDIKISTVSRDDYPELEGKLVDYEYRDGVVKTGIVVGCNRSLGITIVNAENKEHYLVCFAGPVAPGGGHSFDPFACTYNEFFDYTLECIKEGHIVAGDMT